MAKPVDPVTPKEDFELLSKEEDEDEVFGMYLCIHYTPIPLLILYVLSNIL